MTRPAFWSLTQRLRPALCKPVQCNTGHRRATIEEDVRLGLTLRILAGAEILDVCTVFKIGNSTAYAILHDTVDVMNKIPRFPKLPRSEDELHKIWRAFKTSRSQFSPLDGCVGALDGICMKLTKPRNDNIPASFYCRKGY